MEAPQRLRVALPRLSSRVSGKGHSLKVEGKRHGPCFDRVKLVFVRRVEAMYIKLESKCEEVVDPTQKARRVRSRRNSGPSVARHTGGRDKGDVMSEAATRIQ